jgi:hypothetical protein
VVRGRLPVAATLASLREACASRDKPIIKPQAGDILIVGRIVRDERKVVD